MASNRFGTAATFGPALAQLPETMNQARALNQGARQLRNQEARTDMLNAITGEELVRMRNQNQLEQQRLQQRQMPVDLNTYSDMVPEYARPILQQRLVAGGYADAQGMTTAGQLQDFYQELGNDPFVQDEMARAQYGFYSNQINELRTQMQQETNPRRLQELQVQLDQARMGAQEGLNAMSAYRDEMLALQDRVTEESFNEFQRTGNPDVLELRPEGIDTTGLSAGTRDILTLEGPEAARESLSAGRESELRDEISGYASDLARLESERIRALDGSSTGFALTNQQTGETVSFGGTQGLSQEERQAVADRIQESIDNLRQLREDAQSRLTEIRGRVRGQSGREGSAQNQYASEQEIEDALANGDLNYGDVIMFNGQEVRLTR